MSAQSDLIAPLLAPILAQVERTARLELFVEFHTEVQAALRRGDTLAEFGARLFEMGARELGQ